MGDFQLEFRQRLGRLLSSGTEKKIDEWACLSRLSMLASPLLCFNLIPEQTPDDELDIDTLFVADAMSSQLSGN